MFSMTHQKAPAASMFYPSAYAPPLLYDVCARDGATCPVNDAADADVLEGDAGIDSERDREIQDLQADIQRHVNDIKKTHWRWLPGRFADARKGMLLVAHASAEDALPERDILGALWPPVPRSKDVAKHANRLDIHGHVIAIKLWVKAVLFECHYDKTLPIEQKVSLCRATERMLNEVVHSHHGVPHYDRWRLKTAQRHIVNMQVRLEENR